ncbi:hypothetical protein DEO72_LG1g2385 [Vigna unguiculata]|uniref:Uncharacterized protein n=1 Tax=Vigna unguiculata TaxID=3917 RepID=A0A4D6KU52_VIGUN|nr:hypothetical protein DEO72_LG1g2385 [Vigna unguiculata]
MAAATLFGSKFSKKEAANLRTRTIHSQICTCEPEQKPACIVSASSPDSSQLPSRILHAAASGVATSEQPPFADSRATMGGRNMEAETLILERVSAPRVNL